MGRSREEIGDQDRARGETSSASGKATVPVDEDDIEKVKYPRESKKLRSIDPIDARVRRHCSTLRASNAYSSGSPKALTSPASSRHKEKKIEEQKPVIREYQEEEEEEEVESGHDTHPNYPQDSRHFKTICLNVNRYISLRILDRSNINLRFFAEKKTIKIELGTILNLKKKVESYYVDSSLKEDVLKCKFEKLLSSRFKMDNSMQDIIEELKKVKRSAGQRKFMMDKYRPYLRDWLKSGTRCRPR